MSENVRIGVVGTSWWADLMHLPACNSHDRAELAAICGRNRERAEEMAQKYDIPQTYTDFRNMIEQGDLDAIVVSVPDDLHCLISLQALEAGLHVICEKPLAMTVEQAREMYERAEKSGLKHMTYFTNRWMPVMRYMQQLVISGYVGNIVSSEFRYVSGHGLNAGYLWRQDSKHSLGVLGDFGAHAIDLSRWLIGDISAVTAHLTCNVQRRDKFGNLVDAANDSAMLLTEYANGSHGTIHLSNVSHIGDRGQESSITLYGDAGMLQLDSNMKDGYRLMGAKRSEDALKELRVPDVILKGVKQDDPIMQQLQQVFTEHPAGCRGFVDAILLNTEVSPSFLDGLHAQEVIAAAFLSNEERKRVALA